MNYSIRKADISNLDELYNLEIKSNNILLSREILKKDLEDKNSLYVIAINEFNEIVSVVGVNILVDHADITMVLTKKDYQNLGIATLLLNDIIKKCKDLNLSNIFLEVRKYNTSAIKLYEKVGFKKISERKNYYLDNSEDALIYVIKMH